MYDKSKADRAVNFIRLLKHTEGAWAGRSFNLQSWQENQIIRPLYGTVTSDGRRQYRYAYVSLPKKNGKTELAAAIGLKGLFDDDEPGAEIYCVASDRDQASIAFKAALGMRDQCKALRDRSKVSESQRRIEVPRTRSSLRVLSSDVAGKHGYKPHIVIFDELHAQENRDLFDVMSTGFGSRRQPLLLILTTAGYDRHSICYEQYTYAKRVLTGEIEDPNYLSVIYEAPEDADWEDEDVWFHANPALGEFRSIDELRAIARQAKYSPALQDVFRRLYLNQWVQAGNRWLDMDAWDACGEEFDPDLLLGRECYGGLDLATTTDVTAFVLAFPWDDGTVKLVPHFWIPKENLHERVNRDRVPYDVWERGGWLTATEGNAADYKVIEGYILQMRERFAIQEVAYDRWNAFEIVQNLKDEGLEMVPMGQGFASLSAPTKEFQARILRGALHHGGNPVLRWMAGNVQCEQDAAGNIKPSKKMSREKIDGIVASIMALDRIIRHEGEGPSVYEDHGVMFL